MYTFYVLMNSAAKGIITGSIPDNRVFSVELCFDVPQNPTKTSTAPVLKGVCEHPVGIFEGFTGTPCTSY